MAKIYLLLAIIISHAAFAVPVENVKLTLNWKPEPEFGGFYAAKEMGAYQDAGLSVQIQAGGSGTPVVQMIASGQTDFGIVSGDEVVIAQAHGADVVALFAVFQTNPLAIMTHAEKGFTKLADVFQNAGILSMEHGLAYAEFLAKRYPSPKVKIVPYTGGIGNFLADHDFSQQCFVNSEPLAAQKKGVKVKTFLVADEGYNPYVTILAARGELVRKNPHLVSAMVAASRLGWKSYLQSPAKANQIMFGLNKALDPRTYLEIAEAQKPLIEAAEIKDQLGSMSEGRWQQLIKQLSDLKIIDKPLEAKVMFAKF